MAKKKMTRSDYTPREVEACKSVIIEVVQMFGEIKDDIVIIGGWIPALLLPQQTDPHIGSLDLDLALDFEKIPNDTYLSILDSLRDGGYKKNEEQPCIFFKSVEMKGGTRL